MCKYADVYVYLDVLVCMNARSTTHPSTLKHLHEPRLTYTHISKHTFKYANMKTTRCFYAQTVVFHASVYIHSSMNIRIYTYTHEENSNIW